jgi:hypothetical protein
LKKQLNILLVTPAQAGVQKSAKKLDSRLRGNEDTGLLFIYFSKTNSKIFWFGLRGFWLILSGIGPSECIGMYAVSGL